jgi:hypothetical protein
MPMPCQLQAVVRHLVAAHIAAPAVKVGIDRHAFAHLEISDGLARFDDHAAEFVAGDDRERGHVLVAVDVNIRPADTAARHLHHHFVGRAGRVGHTLNAD